MKFIDLINEDDQSEWNKLYKKTQLVFKTLRKGRIRTRSGVKFSYEIPEDSDISVASSHGKDDLTAYVACEKIKIREESKECSDISYSMFGELIKRKFGHFDIFFIFNVYPEDVEKYEPQTINEDEDKDKIIKRGKIIYKGFKTGTVRKGHFGKITYELPDVYNVQLDHSDDIFIKVGKNRSDNEIKFFYVDGTSGEIKPYSLNYSEYKIFVKEINTRKFESFNIELWYDQTEEIN